MDLSYGEEEERFRVQVREFIEQHRDRAPKGQGVMGGQASEAMRAWQDLLLERGYAARTIPRKYGGYGGEPDLTKTIIVSEEFARAGVPAGVSGPGVDMLVPTPFFMKRKVVHTLSLFLRKLQTLSIIVVYAIVEI